MNATKQQRKIPAVSAILGMVIGIGITAALGGGVYYTYQEQADLFATGSNIEVRNVSILRDGDTLTVTGTIKNIGQTSISEVLIDRISVSGLTITQDEDDHIITVSSGGASDTFCLDNMNGGCVHEVEERNARGFSISDGTTDDDFTSSVLEGGRTTAFQLTIASDAGSPTHNVDISDSVNISDSMTMILQYESGDDVLLSEPYTARVRAG